MAFLLPFILPAWVLAARPSATQLSHGRYLVERVGMCADCHTPVDAHGQPIVSRWLQGAPIGFKPVHPVPAWADRSTDIAGLPAGWTPAQLARFLETGLTLKGTRARPPMPAYRLSRRDAWAVAVYLEMLKH
ncbi:Cytochrome c family protein [mine drainage metagenome]|uniref:Cytochrome c family protein n=1 Tax=mine drainage metagenome TaxID=410659 RepID=T0YEL5_9ZZZZ